VLDGPPKCAAAEQTEAENQSGRDHRQARGFRNGCGVGNPVVVHIARVVAGSETIEETIAVHWHHGSRAAGIATAERQIATQQSTVQRKIVGLSRHVEQKIDMVPSRAIECAQLPQKW
jgi:hypothetical protein